MPQCTASCRIFFGPGSSLQIRNVGWETTCLNAVAARCDVVFIQIDLGLDESEFVAEVAQTVVVAAVTLDFGESVPVVEVVDGMVECVEGGGRSIE
jgi:hypothetical protein